MTTLQQMADAIKLEHKQMEALRLRIEYLILKSPGTAPVTVVEAFSSSPIGLKVVRSGFGGDLNAPARGSFAQFCMTRDAVDVLQAVVESGMPGLTHKSTCCVTQKFGSMMSESWGESIHLTAIKASNPQALRLAIKWDRKELSVPQKQLTGAMLHAEALFRAFGRRKKESAVECCRILLQEQAPFVAHDDGIGIPSGIFFGGDDWGPAHAQSITKLLGDYIAAGLVDLDEMPKGLNTPYQGMLPLRAAMAQGNISGAVACIDLGCDITKAMAFMCPERNDDVVKLAYNLIFYDVNRAELRAQMVAGITGALMRRAIREKTMVSSEPSPERARQRVRV